MTTTMRAVVLTASPYTMMLARSELGRISIASRRQESCKRRGSAQFEVNRMNEVACTHLDQIQITQLHAESCCFLDEVTFSVDSGRDA